MAPLEEIPLVLLDNNPTYPAVSSPTSSAISISKNSAASDQTNPVVIDQMTAVTDRYRGSQRYNSARPLGEGAQAYPIDPMKDLTQKIAHMIYYDCYEIIEPEGGSLYNEVHLEDDAGPLLATYEPCSQIDPEQLKEVLAHLRPIVKTTGDATLSGLYDFVKTLLLMRKAWFKAAGGFFGLLAYMDMLETWGIEGGGPSFPGQHGSDLIQWQLGKTQDRHETTYKALQTFKLAPAFTENMRQLQDWFSKLQAENEESRKRSEEARKKAQEALFKRMIIKMRNERAISQQMGQSVAHMGLGRQLYMVETMSTAIHRAMEQTDDEPEKGRWLE